MPKLDTGPPFHPGSPTVHSGRGDYLVVPAPYCDLAGPA
jgi:hypothetical protein